MIADIHFQPKYVFAAIDAGCAAVRVNPGNIKAVRRQGRRDRAGGRRTRACRSGSASTPARSTSGCWRSTARPPPEALVESALWECSLFEEHGFRDIKISVKHNDPVVMIRAYRQLARACDYPLHLGVTEAGPAFQGTIKSAVAFGALLAEGIGDTIRVSLSAPPVEEVKVGNQILESLGLRRARPGDRVLPVLRAGAGGRVHARRAGHRRRSRVCRCRCGSRSWAASSTGRARRARPTSGVASGNGKGQIFVKGEVIKTVPESQIVETLIDEALRLAEEMGADLPEELRGAGAPGRGPLTAVAIVARARCTIQPQGRFVWQS